MMDTFPTIQLVQGKVHSTLVDQCWFSWTSKFIYFSIDQHLLTVIEADGVIIEPYVTTRILIAPGQRYSLLVSTFAPSGRGGFG